MLVDVEVDVLVDVEVDVLVVVVDVVDVLVVEVDVVLPMMETALMGLPDLGMIRPSVWLAS